MKKILLIIGAACLLAVTTFAQTNDPGVQLTADQLAKLNGGVDGLLPLLPSAWQPFIVHALALIAFIGVIGRIIHGWRTGGIGGVFAGLFGGTNTPTNGGGQVQKQAGQMSSRTPLMLLAVLLLPCLLFTGCTTPHQIVTNESGTGLKAKIPVGYDGNNIFELDLTFGTFKTTSFIQPVETNRVYTPTLAVAATTRGKFTGNGMNAGTNNPTAAMNGGDSYAVATGHALVDATNSEDIGISAWQDAATMGGTNK